MDERILTRTKLNDNGCLEWQGYRDKDGYGRIGRYGKTEGLHRYMWRYFRGSIPVDMCVCHRCDNPGCCNVDHLFLGTCADNAYDKTQKARNRSPKGERNGQCKLTEQTVKQLRGLYNSGNYSLTELATRFKIGKETARLAAIGKTWKHL